MLPVVAIVGAAVGVAAIAIKIIADEAKESERHRKQVADLRRQAIQEAAKKKRDALQSEAEHEKWLLARDHLRKLIKVAKKERKSIYENLSTLKVETEKLSSALRDDREPRNGAQGGLDRRSIREAIHAFSDGIDRKYAEAYRYTAFIEEAYRLKDDLYDQSSNSKAAIKAARRFSKESTFDLEDIPIKGQIIVGIVRAPKRGLWFQLDCSIRGRVSEKEENYAYHRKWSKGERVRLFVEWADYQRGIATVSVRKAEFLDAWENGQANWTGKVKKEDAAGIQVALANGAVRAFVPRSKIVGNWVNSAGQASVELLEVDRRLRNVIARPVSSSTEEPRVSA